MKMLKRILSFFSQGEEKIENKKVRRSRIYKYVDHILLREPFHKVLEYHTLSFDGVGDPVAITVTRFHKDYPSPEATSKLRTEIWAQEFSLIRYQEVYGLGLSEVKRIFSSEYDFRKEYKHTLEEKDNKLFYYHEFSCVNLRLCYEFDLTAKGREKLNVVSIKKEEF
jgi:hypothetical protein